MVPHLSGIDIVQTQIKIAQGYSLPELGLTQVQPRQCATVCPLGG